MIQRAFRRFKLTLFMVHQKIHLHEIVRSQALPALTLTLVLTLVPVVLVPFVLVFPFVLEVPV